MYICTEQKFTRYLITIPCHQPYPSDLFSNVIISIFQYKLSITINYVLYNYEFYKLCIV